MTQAELLEILTSDVVEGAKSLLGGTLVKGNLRARIVETEAYRGEDDPGSHSYGKTKMKNMALFGPPGRSYIYFTYGNHWMLNISALPDGISGGILIRAAEPLEGIEEMQINRPVPVKNLLSGPGKLAQAFAITGADNDHNLIFDPAFKIIAPPARTKNITIGPRVGLAKGKGEATLWRFIDAERADWASSPKVVNLTLRND
ncbi:DNA-3-methyladenine glycosylase [soil metagenome]